MPQCTDIKRSESEFLDDPEKWTEEIAVEFALIQGISKLTEIHWEVINYVRGYFKDFGVAPMIRRLSKDTGQSLKQLYSLFPFGPESICKISGLPSNIGCV